MGEIESALEPLEGYFATLKRNTMQGIYELEIGIPKNWVFSENTEIGCEIILETDEGKLIKVFPKNNDIISDDLFLFVNNIIDTNKKIATKEKEFADKMEEWKKSFEDQTKEFYKELDELKENSFKKLNDEFVNEIKDNKVKKDKKTKSKIIEKVDEVVIDDKSTE